jgi:hypothetical protein
VPERMSMRHVRDCVRPKNAGMGRERFVPRRRGVIDGRADAWALRGWEAAGIAWPLAADLTDAMLEQRSSGYLPTPASNPAVAIMGSRIGRAYSRLAHFSFRTFGEFRVHPATSYGSPF